MWERVFGHLADEADKEDAMIDSTIVRAHQQSWGAKGGSDHCEAMGPSKDRFSTKIHATVDASRAISF